MKPLNYFSKLQIIHALAEGSSIRSLERIYGVHRDTIMRWQYSVGTNCIVMHNLLVRNLRPSHIMLDETYAYVFRKDKPNKTPKGPRKLTNRLKEVMGSQWLFLGYWPNTKLVISFAVGRRTYKTAYPFMKDIQGRLANPSADITFVSDGWQVYERCISRLFVDSSYLQAIKNRKRKEDEPFLRHEVKKGNPDPKHSSTNLLENYNLQVRMQNKRHARRGNAFSKKIENHRAAIALTICYRTFCRVHPALNGKTPAMAAVLASHPWSVAELIQKSSDYALFGTHPPGM